MKKEKREEISFVVKTKDHEEYVLDAVDDLLAALDKCAWSQVLNILGDEVYTVKGHAEMIRNALKDHMTFDVIEGIDCVPREMTSSELYPREITFYAKVDKDKVRKIK